MRSSALAKIEVMVGRPNSSAAASHGPLSSNTALDVANTVTRPMYGLSAVFQVAADTTPPTLTSADVEITDALIINLGFSEDLQLSNPPALSAFTVTVDGSAATVSSVGVPGSVLPQNELWLQLSTAIRQRQAVVVTYTDATSGDDTAAIQDTAGNDAATFTTGMDGVPAVTNNSTVTNTVPADWSLIPNGLSTGDKFRLLFLSSTKRKASSSDIADYNTFIQTRAAAGHTDIQDYSADFRAVGCTADTDARDNTKTTYTTTDQGVPIYWLNGAKAADQYEDFYDGSWDEEANNKNESGTNGLDTSQNVNYPWTGCDHDGTEAVTGADSFALGTRLADARVGRPNSSVSGHGPLNGQTNRSDFNNDPLYGLSDVFQVAAAVVVTNNPPTVANAIPDQSATAGTAFSYAFPANTFSDADTGDTLSYTATKTDDTALPTWLAFAADTRTFSGTPQAADAGTVSVKVIASDGNGGSVSDTFDITVAADPNAHCNALDTSELWCGTLTVGVLNVAYGYNAGHSYGSVAPLTFTHGGATITVNGLLYAGTRLQFSMSSALGAGDFSLEIGTGGAKRSFAMNNPGIEADFFNHGLSWSANETVPVKLLLVNTPATGAPAITGTAQVGQTLTATVGDIADVDGLPDPFLTDANTSFQWIRVATDNSETDISGAMAGAYTLVADDQGTTIKVKVSFTGNNGFAETRTSAATAAVSAVAAAVVPADWSLKPTAVAAGAKFRLLFLSSTKRNASSTDIADYNTFIQTRAAAGHTDIQDYSAGFRVVGCTADTDARDNTSTTYTASDKGVPIYWLDGTKAADEYEDFYDGSWDDEANDKNESGTNGPDTSQSVNRPFTGCEHNGTEALDGSISQGFGAAGGTKVGRPNSSSALHGPLSSNAVTGTANTRPLYGLSEVFQVATAVVVNNPPAFSADTAARSVAENTAAGQNVGAALTATDLDGHTLIYTLEGTDAASFGILSASGQIQTRTGVTYNHEAKSTYTVIVKADDGNGGTDTVTVTITVTDVNEPPGRPAAPSVTATAGSSTSLDVSWTAPTNTGPAIASYDLQYREGTSGSFTAGPQDETGTSAAIASLMASTSHQVQVRATNAEGDGDWSFAGTGRTGNNPPAFSADTAARSVAENTAAGQNVGAALTATDADSDTLTYTLEGTDAASFDIVSGSGQIRTRTGVTYNHEAKSTHTVVVKADDGNGGTDTVTVTITVTDVDEPPGRPAAPTVSATAGSTTSLDVSWTAPTNTGPAIASYDLQYRAGTSGNFTNGPQNVTGTSAAIGSLAADTSYEVQVRATNAEGDGDWSFAGTGRTTATSAPGAPTGLTATVSGTTAINLSWTAPGSTGGSAITGYKIEVSPNGTSGWTDQVANTNSTATTYAHTGLAAGDTRHYRVSAINANGAGTASNVDSATTGTSVPGAPTGLTATASGATQIDLSWTAPGSTGGAAITGYKIEVSPNGTSGWTDQVANTNSTATTYAHTGLGGGTTRHYRVSAINTNGAGTASNVDSATTGATAPGAPTGLTATASGTTQIDLSWSAPGSTGGSAITGYKIEVSSNGTSSWTNLVANTNSTATTYAHTGLASGDTRHYRVSAINTNGTGTASNVDSATTGTTAPGAPTGLTATASGTTAIDLSWSAPASTGGSAITGYKIEVSSNGTSGWTDQVANTNSTATTYAHTGLAAGTTRHYRVSAINANGTGVPSNVANATTGATAPGAPTGLTATASGTTAINLSWSAPGSTGGSAITGYKIEVSSNGTSSWTNLVANTNSTATTYAHTGLASGDTRHYRVSAINTNGTGTASNVANATTGQTTVPPTLTSATVFEGGVFINLQFSENMLQSNLPSTDTFTVTAAGSAVTVYTVQPAVFPAAPPNAFWILVRPTIQQGQVVVVTYTDPTAGDDANAIQNTAGNDAATFTTGMDGRQVTHGGPPAVTKQLHHQHPRDGRADDHRHGAGRADADGGHHRHHGCRRADQRQLHVPVDPGGRRRRDEHLRGDLDHLHAGGGRPGQDDQGEGELHRRRQ